MTELRSKPHSLDAEQALIGSIIVKPTVLDEVADIVKKEDFYRGIHSVIYDSLLSMRNRGLEIDAITLRDHLSTMDMGREDGQTALDFIGGPTYLLDLSDCQANTNNAKRYAHIIKRNALYRNLIDIGQTAINIGYEAPEDAEDAISSVASMVFGISLATQHDSVPASTVLETLMKQIREGSRKFITPPGMPNARMSAGDLAVVSAGTSVGKTALTLDWCDHWSKHHKVTYFEYEMPEEDLITRLVCKYAGVSFSSIQDSVLSNEEMERVSDAMKVIAQRKFNLEEVWCDVNALMAKIRREAMQGTELVVIDHLGLIPFKTPKGVNHAKAVGMMVTNQLKRLAAELGIIIVILVQLNREGQKEGFPKLYHLRDSGEIEQDASLVIMAWSDKQLDDNEDQKIRIREGAGILREDELWSNDFNLLRLWVGKNRNGAVGTVKWLMFHGEYFRYEDRDEVMTIGGQKEMF